MSAADARTFGGKVGTRNNAPVVDLPGVQIRFASADAKQAPTRGRVLDHIGFDVRDHQALVKKLEAEGIVNREREGERRAAILDSSGNRSKCMTTIVGN